MAARFHFSILLLTAALASACDDDASRVGDGRDGGDGAALDSGQVLDGQVSTDLGRRDVGPARDGALPPDAEAPPKDAEVLVDGALPPDAAPPADSDVPPADGDVPPADGDVPPADSALPLDGDVPPPDGDVPPADMGPDQGCRRDCDNDGVAAVDGDCDDNDPTVFPGAAEICDGADNNCDGVIDGVEDECYTGPAGTLGIGACRAGAQRCDDGAFGACLGQTVPGDEVCGDGLDGDCDGTVDEGCDGDGDGFTIAQGDCRDDVFEINPGAPEVCDGIDNDCDRVVDGNAEDCYEGPAGTMGVGICAGGVSICEAGVPGECGDQVLPEPTDACGNGTDDDCDGSVDEGCNVDACPDVDLNSRVYLTSDCLAVQSGGAALVVVDLRDSNGRPIPDADLDITVSPRTRLSVLREANGLKFKVVFAPGAPTNLRFTATVGCEDGNRIALNTVPVMRVAPALAAGTEVVTGGCDGPQGNFQATITDANTGLPIDGAWLMVGASATSVYQTDGQNALRNRPGNGSNVTRSGPDGRARLLDLGGTLQGPQLVTVGAEGYENVTLAGLDASLAIIPLRPVAPPAPVFATIDGQMTQFNSLARDNQADAGLVTGSFDLPFLAQLNISRLLSRSNCWDPVTEGLAGGFVNPVPVPGNLYVPEQSETVFGVPVTIEEHRFTLSDVPTGTDNLVGIAGKVPSQEVVDLLVGGGSLNALLEILELQEIGVVRDRAINGDVANLNVPLTSNLAANASCTVTNIPANAAIACVSAGDWSGGNGTGRLFPMGIVNVSADGVNDVRPGPLVLPMTTVPPQGNFANIGYLTAVVALYTGPDDGALDNAVSAVLDRETLDANGGDVAVGSFFTPPTVSRDQFVINWDPVGNANSPPVDACRVDVVRTIVSTYDPGDCTAQNYAKTREEPVWTAYIGSDPGTLALPRVPADWPRSAVAGFVDPNATPEQDFLSLRITCMGLGLAADFDFDASNFRALIDGLTHVAVNTVRF